MIELRHIGKTYSSSGGDVVALEDIDLCIPDGAIYGVIGLSGAGKSTLVRCINLLERPTTGEVIIDGEDLTKVKKKRLLEIRRGIGMIFQSFNLLEQRTVEANVRFPLEIAQVRKTVEVKRKKRGEDENTAAERALFHALTAVMCVATALCIVLASLVFCFVADLWWLGTLFLVIGLIVFAVCLLISLRFRPKSDHIRKKRGEGGTKEFVTEQKEVYVRYRREQMQQRVKELLQLVGLADKAKAYPSQLSGGQKQRVAIARALATKPKYLLCDEATSALDPNTTQSILELLKDINRTLGVTIIVITHEMKVVESICSEVAVIDQSRIVERGKVADVFSFPQSEIAKELIIPNLIRSVKSAGGKKLRLVFNGEEADMPVISGLALRCGISVNILYADTKNIDGKTYGHMVITLPEEEEKAELVKKHLAEQNVTFKEEI